MDQAYSGLFGPILAETLPGAFERTWQFFVVGGFFMGVIVVCSVVAVAVIVFKFLSLRKDRIVPAGLARDVELLENHLGAAQLEELTEGFQRGDTALARLCSVALANAGRPQTEVKEAVQSSAREEIVKMNAGLPVLEVIINIAPLLGLLGTASGLMVVFRDLGSTADQAAIARGIAMALSTTIVGLAVAVPAVIAHSHFSRKVETMSARLEVLLGKVVSACRHHVFDQQAVPATPVMPEPAVQR
jgi:biopolymer transport protein ExbB